MSATIEEIKSAIYTVLVTDGHYNAYNVAISAIDELAELRAKVEKLEAELKHTEARNADLINGLTAQVYHWKANHDAQVAAARLLRERVDMPVERVRAYDELIALRKCTDRINEIRNSIVGFQTVNWSKHVYPLVAALDDAGIKGEGYEVSSEKATTILDDLKELRAELATLKEELRWRKPDEEPDWSKANGYGELMLEVATQGKSGDGKQIYLIDKEFFDAWAVDAIKAWRPALPGPEEVG